MSSKAKVSVFNSAVHDQLAQNMSTLKGLHTDDENLNSFFVVSNDPRAYPGHSMPRFRSCVGTTKTESSNNTLDMALPSGDVCWGVLGR